MNELERLIETCSPEEKTSLQVLLESCQHEFNDLRTQHEDIGFFTDNLTVQASIFVIAFSALFKLSFIIFISSFSFILRMLSISALLIPIFIELLTIDVTIFS